jgi:hypothetical protein
VARTTSARSAIGIPAASNLTVIKASECYRTTLGCYVDHIEDRLSAERTGLQPRS